jgi:hypothetical protein
MGGSVAGFLRALLLRRTVGAPGSRPTCLSAADGVHSTIRRRCLPAGKPALAAYVAWRGLMAERDMPRGERAALLQAISDMERRAWRSAGLHSPAVMDVACLADCLGAARAVAAAHAIRRASFANTACEHAARRAEK